MYRLLNKEAQAPLPLVYKAIRRYERKFGSVVREYEFNRDVISILHAHNWRKRDYLRELRTRGYQAHVMQCDICKPPYSP